MAVPAMGSQPEVFQQPIQIFCDVSTRVVAGDLNVGINPLTSTLVYELKKYHATKPSQNYEIKGSNQTGYMKSVSFSNNLGFLSIHATAAQFTRVPKPLQPSIHITLKKMTSGNYTLAAFYVDGVNHGFENSPAYCKITQ